MNTKNEIKTRTEIKSRTCICCKQSKPLEEFAPSKSPFFPSGYSTICLSCLERKAPAGDWNATDQLCRYLDIPLDLSLWTDLYKKFGAHTLTAYVQRLGADEHYAALDWTAENERWRNILEEGILDDEIPDLGAAELKRLHKRWSEEYTTEDCLWLDNMLAQITATQNVSTPILLDYAKDYCEISLRIKKRIRSGEDVKKEMDSRDNIIKVAGFEAKNAINIGNFDSVGELITYYSKKGWQPNWAQEKKDVVDFTMSNIQQYLRRLVVNEGTLAEQVEQRKATLELAQQLEDEPNFEETIPDLQLEGADEFDYELSEFAQRN